jgi:hypothetical protein
MPWFSDNLDQFVARYCDSLDQARAIAEAPAVEVGGGYPRAGP